jgi:hypothetical protein
LKQTAFVTYQQIPDLTSDDRLCAALLEQSGVSVRPVLWDDQSVRWESFETIVIRSCWDYHTRPAEFYAWLNRLEQIFPWKGVWNPVRVLRWNANKTYLRDLASRSVRIAPTRWLERGSQVDLAAELERQQWKKAVIKPTIGATAYHTWITSPETATHDQIRLDALLERSGVMLQSYIEEIETNGEWSLLFFGGKFSHAVLKRPQEGDFRVQNEYGGYIDTERQPSAALIEQAQRILRMVNSSLLYARVDGVEINGWLTLMELELIEPTLFLGTHPRAAGNFAQAILRTLG